MFFSLEGVPGVVEYYMLELGCIDIEHTPQALTEDIPGHGVKLSSSGVRSSYKNIQRSTTLQMKSFPNHTIDSIDDMAWNISGDMGLVSAGRINKDTPPLTTPSHTSKSSAMDTSSYIF